MEYWDIQSKTSWYWQVQYTWCTSKLFGKTICIELNSYLKNWILVKYYYDGDCFKMTSTVLGVVYNRSFVWYFIKKSNNELKCYSSINHCLFLLIDKKILIDIKTKTISTQNYLYVFFRLGTRHKLYKKMCLNNLEVGMVWKDYLLYNLNDSNFFIVYRCIV